MQTGYLVYAAAQEHSAELGRRAAASRRSATPRRRRRLVFGPLLAARVAPRKQLDTAGAPCS